MSYINETVGSGKQILDGNSKPQFFVVTATGSRFGPYMSRAIAEGVILGQPMTEQSQCIISEVLGNGSALLLG